MRQFIGDDFRSFFTDATGFQLPYDWQVRVARDGLPEILPIPTGLGKTEGVVLAWAWRRLVCNVDEPLHLVYCLPMRTLVTQTVERLSRYFKALTTKRQAPSVSVYQLMGVSIEDDWASNPDRPWVIVGTQDQLLSRALNRGYAMSRFDWPVHFGLLNQDCHWIIDEVQLMGPGLWTTAQLDWMRRKRFNAIKPCRTTWMSATVGQSFLATTDRKKDGLDTVGTFDAALDKDRNPELRRRCAAIRAIEWLKPSSGKRAPDLNQQITNRILKNHREGTLSLVICNTVKDAQGIFLSLPYQPPKILLTSRFRREDRREYEERLLDFESRRSKSESSHIEGDPGLICVSTQVVEAGIDISAHSLWSQLAPWPSVIQRLGRLNRDGRDNSAVACFWQPIVGKENKQDGELWIGPYLKRELDLAKKLLEAVRPLTHEMPFSDALSKLEESEGARVREALQPKPTPLPRALDVHGLFSTERDLHGGFTDISAFVRDAARDADVTVVWRAWQGFHPPRIDELSGPPLDPDAEGCRVAVWRLQDLLTKSRAKAWIWNDEESRWQTCPTGDLSPGMTIMIQDSVGGYSERLGWTGDGSDVPAEVLPVGPGKVLADEELSEADNYVDLTSHLNDARLEAIRICESLNLTGSLRAAIVEAAAAHDVGKAHSNWQSAIPSYVEFQSGPWAKFPHVLGLDVESPGDVPLEKIARICPAAHQLGPLPVKRGVRLRWIVDRKLTRDALDKLRNLPSVSWAGNLPFRPGMRHEAASALAMWTNYREGMASYPALAVYLVAAHHGKVRTVLRSTTQRGDDIFGIPPHLDSLELNGRKWMLDFSIGADGAAGEWTEDGFVLTDYGWTGLVSDLLGPWQDDIDGRCYVGAVPDQEPRLLGPFALAWLEALVRVADWRASANPSSKRSPSEVLHG